MENESTFSEALTKIMTGKRMSARFLPENVYIELQVPDPGSMNTEPYLKMVSVTDEPNANGSFPSILTCEPWEPGRRSLFSSQWYESKYEGIPVAK